MPQPLRNLDKHHTCVQCIASASTEINLVLTDRLVAVLFTHPHSSWSDTYEQSLAQVVGNPTYVLRKHGSKTFPLVYWSHSCTRMIYRGQINRLDSMSCLRKSTPELYPHSVEAPRESGPRNIPSNSSCAPTGGSIRLLAFPWVSGGRGYSRPAQATMDLVMRQHQSVTQG